MRALSLGGSPLFRVCVFICASGWTEPLDYPYRCLRRRSARGEGICGWLLATRHPQFGMRPFCDRSGADVGTNVQRFRKFFESSRLCLLFLNCLCCFHTRSLELRRRGKVRPGRDPRCPGMAIVRTGGRHIPEHTV